MDTLQTTYFHLAIPPPLWPTSMWFYGGDSRDRKLKLVLVRVAGF